MDIAYGFIGLQHLFNTRVAEAGTQRINTALQETAAEHNRMIETLMGELVEKTTLAQEEYALPNVSTLQPLDEKGIPKPRTAQGSYKVAYPIEGGGDAWGVDRVASELMTVEEVNRQTVDVQNADADWNARHIIAALLAKSTWTFKDKVGPNGGRGLGDITIMPLANGDTIEYPRKGLPAAVADHYTAQAAAISDGANPFPTFYSKLTTYPSNGSKPTIVSYIPENLRDEVEGLSTFKEMEDPDIKAGANRDVLVANIAAGFGDEVLGKVGKVWVVLWRRMPDNYIISHVRGRKPLKMREYPAAALQGLFPENYSPDGARKEWRWIRYAGFGVANRLAAMCHFVGNATYQNPAEYTPPLAQ